MNAVEHYDYVIVGGGTAGCVVAYRLAVRGHSVCVIEAGPPDTNPFIRIPAGFVKTLDDPRVTYQLAIQPSAGSGNRPVPLVLGKTLGGSSAVNGAVYNRGQAADFDGWAALGNDGWSYAEILPYFMRTERYMSDGDDRFRGRDGNMLTSETKWPNPASDAFMQSAVNCGIPLNDDYNGEHQHGVGRCQGAIHNGRRYSAAHAYLHPARRRHGVRVLTNATVTRVNLDGCRATGVSYRKRGDGPEVEIRAGKGVVMAAGTAHSPKLLQLSGIGPAELLKSHGVPVLHHLPGVGQNLRDHFAARLVVRARKGVDGINNRAHGLGLLKEIASWAIGRPSILSLCPILVYAFGKSDPALSRPDITLTFTPASYQLGMLGVLDSYPGFTCGASQMRPESTGYANLSSADPSALPELQPNYLSAELDQRIIVASLKKARSVLESAPLRQFVETELHPGSGVESDDEWLGFAKQYGMTQYHLVGSCKMGSATDPMAVVDHRLRVHGIEGLRVIDASIMPTLPSANTCASTMMIAEKGADMILEDAG